MTNLEKLAKSKGVTPTSTIDPTGVDLPSFTLGERVGSTPSIKTSEGGSLAKLALEGAAKFQGVLEKIPGVSEFGEGLRADPATIAKDPKFTSASLSPFVIGSFVASSPAGGWTSGAKGLLGVVDDIAKITNPVKMEKFITPFIQKLGKTPEEIKLFSTKLAGISDPSLVKNEVLSFTKASLEGSALAKLAEKGKVLDPLAAEARKYVYHGTNEEVLDSISKEGLKPSRKGTLSLSKDEAYAKSFARDGITPQGKTNAVMLRVKSDFLEGKTVSSNKPRPASDQLNEILTKETIPPDALEIYKNGKWQPLKENPLIAEARKLSESEFVSKNIFENSLVGEQRKVIENYNGKTFADKLSSFHREINSLEPLAQEARKYKSAEEFGERIKDLAMQQRAGIELQPEQKAFMTALRQLPKEVRSLKPSELFEKLRNPKSQLTDFYNKAVGASQKLPSELVKEIPTQTPRLSPSSGKKSSPSLEAQIIEQSGKEVKVGETALFEQTISKTAREVKDTVPIVKRVTNSLRKTFTNVVEYVQNSEERVRQLVRKPGIKVDDISDPYLKATLYHGRVADKVEQGYVESKAIIGDIKRVANEFKSTSEKIRKEVSDYLRFRHAPERNLALGDGAAGITTKEAQVGLKAIEKSAQGAKVKEIADKASKLNEQVLDLLHNSGVISDDLFSTLRTKYKNHVPLNRIFEETEDIGSVLSGKGFDVKSTGLKKAIGSQREVDDILTNIVTNYEQAVLRSEKNIVDQATLAFARKNKDIVGDLLEVVKPKAVGTTFDGKIILEKTTDPTILQLYENGKPIWVKIKDPNLAIALRGVGREKLGPLLNTVSRITRFYSGLATRFNPEFALPNKIRDLQETAVYLASQKGMGFKSAGKTITHDMASVKDVISALKGADTQGARLYNEMKSLGGTTGGFGLSTRNQVALNLDKLEKLANSKTRNIANNLIEYVDNWNTIFEDSTRLSVYKRALEQGLSKERAAFLAKEASINFNRMGKGGPVINALWMFSNASIQGSAKMIRSLKNPKVLGATVLTVGASVAAVNEWNDMVDPEWRNNVSKWDRLNGLPIVLPSADGEGVKYFTIPVSWGLKPIKVMTEYAYDALQGQKADVKTMMGDTVTAIVEAYNPAGGSDLTSALIPTILDVPVEINRNKSWNGNPIRPDFDKNAPADIQYFPSLDETKTGQVSISISELLKDKADIAISPANIKYGFDQYVGGAGRAISKTVNTITGFVTGKPAPIDEYPLISRFYRERSEEELGTGAGGDTQEIKKILEEQSRDRFGLKRQAEALDKELQSVNSETANARTKALKTENPALYEKLKDVYQERKLGLTYTEKLMKQLGVENGERAKYIHEQIMALPQEKRQAYYEELKTKKLISPEIAKQLSRLQNK